MPELAEVETVRRTLEKEIVGLKIKDIDIRYENMIDCDINDFISNIKGQNIISLNRRGKVLIFNLSNNKNILSHLRMEGKYFYEPNLNLDNKHVHVVFMLSNGYYLMYQDVRKFGRMWLKNNDELYTTKPIIEIGFDPVLDKSYDVEKIYKEIHQRKIEIKATLLDQSIIAGLGNIYVDEVLFYSKINPHRPSNTISIEEVEKIIKETIRILNLAIKYKGTTIKTFTSSHGVEGEYQKFLAVHTKTICPCCNSKLICDKIKGRTTYYCSMCQGEL